jgi:lysyl-tRNA synthetase class 1
VAVEPSGRDHSTKGGSIDTGVAIQKQIFKTEPPIQVAYDFVNRAGETKKMSASAGTGINATEVVEVLPPEIVRYFILRYAPSKRLFFDPIHVAQLIDEFAAEITKSPNSKIIEMSRAGADPVVSGVPFSHLVASYQAALKDPEKALENIARTEHGPTVENQKDIIKKELAFIDQWLAKWAPEEVKFELLKRVEPENFSEAEKDYLRALSEKVAQAPAEADGDWFHKLIYELDGTTGLNKQQLFTTLYKALIGKESGPRAGWFLSILPRDWLIKRLRFEI